MNIGREYLEHMLYDSGYEKETIVTETGKLGVRGYVLDIFPIGEQNPVRIEFWGDEVDSIKYFDIDSQLSIDNSNVDSIDWVSKSWSYFTRRTFIPSVSQ